MQSSKRSSDHLTGVNPLVLDTEKWVPNLNFTNKTRVYTGSEENLLTFLDQLNKFHKTINFTYSYSKTNAVFLDVKLFKSKEGSLHTSVFEKILMCISILNSHPVILFHAKKVSHLAKQNDIDV